MPTRRESSAADLGRLAYSTLTALVVPRPIAWVSTVDESGRGNVAPHSFFTVASAAPPVVSFTSVGHKDTLRNVLATGEFVVNVVTWAMRHVVNETSIDAPHEVDEAEYTGLRTEPSALVRPWRIADSPAALECRLVQTVSFGDPERGSVVVFGEVVHVAVDEDLMLDDGLPSTALLQPASRLDRANWAPLGPFEAITRPRWSDRTGDA